MAVDKDPPYPVVPLSKLYVPRQDFHRVPLGVNCIVAIGVQAAKEVPVKAGEECCGNTPSQKQGNTPWPVGFQKVERGHNQRQGRILGSQPAHDGESGGQPQSVSHGWTGLPGNQQKRYNQRQRRRELRVYLGGIDEGRRRQAYAQRYNPAG